MEVYSSYENKELCYQPYLRRGVLVDQSRLIKVLARVMQYRVKQSRTIENPPNLNILYFSY